MVGGRRLDGIAASYGESTSWPIYAFDQAAANTTDRQQRSRSSPPPHRQRQGNLPPQPVETGGAAGIPGLLLGLNGSAAPVGVGVHVRSAR